MIELPLVFLAGILGSSHCLGMCGPFALSIGGGAPQWRANLGRQVIYSGGRIFTYATMGAAGGFAGLRLAQYVPDLVNVPALLALAAGLLLIYQGLSAAGLWRRRAQPAASGCLASTFFGAFLVGPQASNYFLAGIFTGFLPCGLVYAFLTMATSSASIWRGSLIMLAFGLGTVPLMVLVGCGAGVLTVRYRAHLYRVAAWCVVLAGLASVCRGLGFVHLPGWIMGAGCPYCAS